MYSNVDNLPHTLHAYMDTALHMHLLVCRFIQLYIIHTCTVQLNTHLALCIIEMGSIQLYYSIRDQSLKV